LIEGFE
jgi:Phytanoyl-CoA dioxygenase (PhyH)